MRSAPTVPTSSGVPARPAAQIAALARPDQFGVNRKSKITAELDALLPSILDQAFKGEL